MHTYKLNVVEMAFILDLKDISYNWFRHD
jgi:hypothetical protein